MMKTLERIPTLRKEKEPHQKQHGTRGFSLHVVNADSNCVHGHLMEDYLQILS